MFQLGDMVVFTDEFGKQRVERIVNENVMPERNKDLVSIKGSYGCYIRNKKDIRPAEHWEVHQAAFSGGELR